MRRLRRSSPKEAELDITSFMNLMIVLVPVLLLGLVFSQVRILNLQLPIISDQENEQNDEPKVLDLMLKPQGFVLNYRSVFLKNIDKVEGQYDFAALSIYLQDLKLSFQQKQIDKRDIVLMLAKDTDYQTIVSTMDTVRSFETVVTASVVDAELFPDISLADLPVSNNKETNQ